MVRLHSGVLFSKSPVKMQAAWHCLLVPRWRNGEARVWDTIGQGRNPLGNQGGGNQKGLRSRPKRLRMGCKLNRSVGLGWGRHTGSLCGMARLNLAIKELQRISSLGRSIDGSLLPRFGSKPLLPPLCATTARRMSFSGLFCCPVRLLIEGTTLPSRALPVFRRQPPGPVAKPGQGLEHVLSSAALTWQCDAVHGEEEMKNMINKDENDRKKWKLMKI